jgi:hypothetical protein
MMCDGRARKETDGGVGGYRIAVTVGCAAAGMIRHLVAGGVEMQTVRAATRRVVVDLPTPLPPDPVDVP